MWEVVTCAPEVTTSPGLVVLLISPTGGVRMPSHKISGFVFIRNVKEKQNKKKTKINYVGKDLENFNYKPAKELENNFEMVLTKYVSF